MDGDEVVTVGTGQTPARSPRTSRSPTPYRVATVALWMLLFALWTATRPWPYLHGLLFVLLGTCALLLTTVAAGGWHVAASRTMAAWEAAARAAWTTGGLGTVVFFERVLLGPSENLAATANALALSFAPALLGGGFAAALLARMLRAAPGDRPAPDRARATGSAWDLWLGRTLLLLLVAWPVLRDRVSDAGWDLAGSVWMLHWPAVLVLLGVVAALSLLGGRSLRERAASAAVAGAGTLTSLLGLVQALVGIARADLASVVAGLSFLVTACFTTLLALALVTYPGDDRHVRDANGGLLGARVSWVLFPLLALVLLAITFLVILTPMTRTV